MEGFILAAGLGTRLRPLTNDRPKALVEIDGVTLLEMAIRRLEEAGIGHIVVNVHHFADKVIDFIKSHTWQAAIDINDAHNYNSPEYSDAFGTFIAGDIRLYSNTCALDSPVGIGEIQNSEFNIQIYPNPTTSRVTVQCPMPVTTSYLTDMMGRRKEVKLTPAGNGRYTLDLTAYPQGAYFLILTAADGQQRTLRLIKQSNATHRR